MIKSVQISNFQSHEQSELNFHPGVNIIVGSSDSGKSAIIRAIRWVSWNKPSGDAIRSNWGGKTEVTLEVEKGWVVRTKDKLDSYILNNQSAEFAFKAFGTNVPEEIIGFLNLNEVNLQHQLDAPFLLSDTPGQVAQHFNRVAKLDKIDTSTQKINSAIRELTSDIRYSEEQEAKLKEELKGFEHLEKMEVEIEVLEGMESDWLSRILNKNSFDKLIRNIKHIDVLIDNASTLLQYEKPLDNIFHWKSQIEDLGTQGGDLDYIVRSIKQTQVDIDYYNNVATLETKVNTILDLYTEVNTLKSNKIRLSKAMQVINSTKYSLTKAESLHLTLEAKFDEMFPDVCPLCGSKTK